MKHTCHLRETNRSKDHHPNVRYSDNRTAGPQGLHMKQLHQWTSVHVRRRCKSSNYCKILFKCSRTGCAEDKQAAISCCSTASAKDTVLSFHTQASDQQHASIHHKHPIRSWAAPLEIACELLACSIKNGESTQQNIVMTHISSGS